jgi:aryl-alcohol dehydrogenase-like predicted oxidoreductase
VEGSLKRLGTDYLDLFQLHSPPVDVVARGDWVYALESMKKAGKIRYYGVSCDTMDAGLAALEFPGVSSVQFPFNLFERRAEQALLPKLRERAVAGIARECLANGALVKDATEIDLAKYCTPEELPDRIERLRSFREEAVARGSSVAKMAVELAVRSPGVSVTLVGARSADQLAGLLKLLG